MKRNISGLSISKFNKIKDDRGSLIVFLKQSEIISRKHFGQIYYVTFDQRGAVRGNHYHTKSTEWFGVVVGNVKVVVENVKTKARQEILLSSRKNQYTKIQIDPYCAHAIQCLSKKAVLLSYCNTEWTSEDDTHHHKLI